MTKEKTQIPAGVKYNQFAEACGQKDGPHDIC